MLKRTLALILFAVTSVPAAYIEVNPATVGDPDPDSFAGTIGAVGVTVTYTGAHLNLVDPVFLTDNSYNLFGDVAVWGPDYANSALDRIPDRHNHIAPAGDQGTITISFSQALTDPVLLLKGLQQSDWDFSATTGLTGISILHSNLVAGSPNLVSNSPFQVQDMDPTTGNFAALTDVPDTGAASGSVQLFGTLTDIVVTRTMLIDPGVINDGQRWQVFAPDAQVGLPEPGTVILLAAALPLLGLLKHRRLLGVLLALGTAPLAPASTIDFTLGLPTPGPLPFIQTVDGVTFTFTPTVNEGASPHWENAPTLGGLLFGGASGSSVEFVFSSDTDVELDSYTIASPTHSGDPTFDIVRVIGSFPFILSFIESSGNAANVDGNFAFNGGSIDIFAGTAYTFVATSPSPTTQSTFASWEFSPASAGPEAVPEPGTVALLGLGLLGLCVVRRRRSGTLLAAALMLAPTAPAITLVSSDLTLEFQQSAFPLPAPLTQNGQFSANIAQQDYEHYSVGGELNITPVPNPFQVDLSFTNVDIICQEDFCDPLTATATFNATLLDDLGLGFNQLMASIDGEFMGVFGMFHVSVMGQFGLTSFNHSEFINLMDGDMFSIPLVQVSPTPPGTPPPHLVNLNGQMVLRVVEPLVRDDRLQLPSSFDLSVTANPIATPEPGAIVLLGLGLAALGALHRRRRNSP